MFKTCGPFTKTNKEYQKTELGKTCFQHDMPYRCLKDLLRTAASDKVLSDKAFDVAKNTNIHISRKKIGYI